jgi:choline dehydrogenase
LPRSAPLVAPDPDVTADDDRLRHWILSHVNTAYHPAGTCRMGPDGDDQAVVDQRLQVRGVQGLYVADASVMPRIPTGFTNIPCYMVGERLADWLRDET